MSVGLVSASLFNSINGIFAHVFPSPSLMFVAEKSRPKFLATFLAALEAILS